MPKFCKECGAPLAEGVRFCTSCGTPIIETTTAQNTAPAADHQQSYQQSYQQNYQQPAQQPQPQAQQQKKAKPVERINTYPDIKSQGVGWDQFKPKLTIGKPQVSFISKGKLIFVIIIFIIILLAALFQSCGSVKETTNKSQTTSKSSTATKITINNSSSSTLLKSTNTNGVKSFTLFDVDNKSLTRDETQQLDALAREIKAMGSCQVMVIGHADNTGTSEVNEAVSTKRARLVADYLKKKGVSNVTSSGESYNHPVAGNDTAAGRAKNRRVEIYVSTIGRYNPYN